MFLALKPVLCRSRSRHYTISHRKTLHTDLHGCHLPTVDPRVEVSGDEYVNVRVQGREEPPVHGEDLADVPGGRVVPHVADVEAGVGAREVTQPPHLRVVRLEVIINPDGPPGVVTGNQVQVVSNTLNNEGTFLIWNCIVHLKIFTLFALCRVWISIKREADHFLSRSSLKACFAASGIIQRPVSCILNKNLPVTTALIDSHQFFFRTRIFYRGHISCLLTPSSYCMFECFADVRCPSRSLKDCMKLPISQI